jgi:hypothetical protein
MHVCMCTVRVRENKVGSIGMPRESMRDDHSAWMVGQQDPSEPLMFKGMRCEEDA